MHLRTIYLCFISFFSGYLHLTLFYSKSLTKKFILLKRDMGAFKYHITPREGEVEQPMCDKGMRQGEG